MVSSQGFWNEFSWRHVESLKQIFDIFVPFSKEYINVVFINKAAYYGVIFSLILMNIIKDLIKNKDIKITLKYSFYSIAPLIGVCLYYFSLIMLGPTFPGIGRMIYWVYEPFYNMVYIMILCSIFCFLISLLLRDIENVRIKILLILLFIILFIISNRIDIFIKYKNALQEKKEKITTLRETIYKCDKILISQFYNNEKIILPSYCGDKSLYINDNNWAIRYFKVVYNINLDNKISIQDNFSSKYEIITDKEKKKLKFSTRF